MEFSSNMIMIHDIKIRLFVKELRASTFHLYFWWVFRYCLLLTWVADGQMGRDVHLERESRISGEEKSFRVPFVCFEGKQQTNTADLVVKRSAFETHHILLSSERVR
jgi:hypothetical protein